MIKHCAQSNLGERGLIVLTVPGYRPDSRDIKVGIGTITVQIKEDNTLAAFLLGHEIKINTVSIKTLL